MVFIIIVENTDNKAMSTSEYISVQGIEQKTARNTLEAELINGKPIILHNIQTNEDAVLSKSSIGKLLSNAAVAKSMRHGFTRNQHYEVASKIKVLYKKAIKVEQRQDRNNDINMVAIHRFAAPFNLENDTSVAYITVKESIEHGKRIYSIELMEIKKLEGILGQLRSTNADGPLAPTSSISSGTAEGQVMPGQGVIRPVQTSQNIL